jgi:hypothetical protein
MVTHLYFVATDAAPVSPAFDSNWASTAQAVRRKLGFAQASATETLSGSLAGTADDEDLIVQLISPPLSGDQTVSGTVTIVSRGRELAGTDNINSRPRAIRVVKPDLTDRGVAEAYTVPASTTELSTSLSGQQHMTNGGITSVSALDGDRIVVEIGYRESGTGTTPNWEMVLGGTGTDHGTAANNDTTGTVPWLEFSATLTFKNETTTPAAIAAAASLPQPGVGIGAAPAAIGVTVALPAPASVGQGGGGDATVTPAAIACTAALPQAGVGVGAAPAVVQTAGALPQASVGVGAAPAAIAATVAAPQAAVSVGAAPAVLQALAALPQPGVGVGAVPAVIGVVVALPLPTSVGQSGDATVTPAAVAAVVALPAAAIGVGAGAAVLAAVAALPQAAVGVGAAPAVVPAVVALPLAMIVIHALAQPAAIAAIAAVPQSAIGAGAAPAVIAVVVALPLPERVGPPAGININPEGPDEVGAITTQAVALAGSIS